MRKSSEVHDASARRRMDMLLRSVMISLFATGALAIGVLWILETKFGLIDRVSRMAYPILLATFLASAAMLYRWPRSVAIARWVGFCAISGFLAVQLMVAMSADVHLVGNYPFISLIMWLPLAYAIALFMLETRYAPWAACALFVLIASLSLEHITHSRVAESSDTLLLVNLLASHLVLLACLGGLVTFKSVLFHADVRSRHLLEQASTDPLTGLANRRYGLEMLRRAAVAHTAATPSAVMLGDLDAFKGINDRSGHDVGDQVVLAVASVLRSNTREIDTVVRWGGDEFLIVVPGVGRPGLGELAERIRARVGEIVLFDDEERRICPSMSLGIAQMSAGEVISAWIKRADEALYLAKAGGRNQWVFAEPPVASDLPLEPSHPPEWAESGFTAATDRPMRARPDTASRLSTAR